MSKHHPHTPTPALRSAPSFTAHFHSVSLLRTALLVAFAACAGTVVAQDEQPAANGSWLDGVRAQCEQQYSMEECADPQFLNEKFHVDSLQAAHKSAIKRRDQEEDVLRELLLQRACNNRKAYCAQNATLGCAEQLEQMCAAVARQAIACVAQAKMYCAAFPQNADCLAQRQAQCPSTKRQSVDRLLAKYPRLSAQQQEHVRLMARQIDTNYGGSWIGDLFRRLGF